MHGKGIYTWPDGRRYEGTNYLGCFENDMKHGKGLYIWSDGRKYEGDFLNNKQHGIGEYTSKSGEKRKGMWENGIRKKWLDEEEV